MQIFNDKKKRIGLLSGFKDRAIATTLDSGDKELSFSYPASGAMVEMLKEEYYIRTKTDEFVLKAVEKGEKFNKYTAVLNVEELEGTTFPYGFESDEQTIRACLEFAFEGTGWSIGVCTVTKKRTIDEQESVTAWDVLQKCLSTYRCECIIHSLTKTIDIYDRIGNDRGCYFIEGLNLRKISLKSDTYDFYTRIYPIGKDGITPKWLTGKDYIDNFQYSSKIKAYTWKDERYTNTTSLIEDATAKIEEMSRPYKAYTAEIIDLAKASEEYKDILLYGIGDTVTLVSKKTKTKEKQRIVKITEYPESPQKNTVEISNARKTFAEIQKEETEAAKGEAISIANSTTKKILKDDYYTKEDVESHITASEERISLGVSKVYETKEVVTEKVTNAINEANAATDQKLTEYSTTEEMQAAIEMTAESIDLEVSKTYATKTTVTETFNSAVLAGQQAANKAEENANAATDQKLTEYSTTEEMQAALKINTDAITTEVTRAKKEEKNLAGQIETVEENLSSKITQTAEEISTEVNKKVNNSEFGTKISQNAYYVRVAWNNNSNYIQFENGGISVYDGSVEQSKKRAVFNYSGEHFYRDGYYVGKIGTNQWSGNNAHKGLVFDLEYTGKYMAFAQEKTENAGSYTTMLCFSRANSIYDEYGVHFGCDVYGHWFTLNDFKIGSISSGGYTAFTGTIPIIMNIEDKGNGSIGWTYSKLQVKNGIIVGYWN